MYMPLGSRERRSMTESELVSRSTTRVLRYVLIFLIYELKEVDVTNVCDY